MTKKEKMGQIGWNLVLLLITFIFMTPLIFMISMSLRTTGILSACLSYLLQDITFLKIM